MVKRALKDAEIEALDNSKPLDVHIWSEHPEVNAFVDPIYENIFEGRKGVIRKKHLKVVLLDLYVTWTEDPTRTIAVSRNPNCYKARTRYNELHISRLTIHVVDELIDAGLIEQTKGFKNRDTGFGRNSRICPTETLIKMFREAHFSPLDIGNHQDRLTVILRDNDPEEKKNRDIEYEPTEETERMTAMLTSYNDLLASTFIDIPTLEEPFIETNEGGRTSKLAVSQRDKFVRRVFNRRSFDFGGRFYGGWWQRCPKDYRSKIFIDDQPTNEIDFSGLHIVMLYAMEGVDYWRVEGIDPYEIDMPDFLDDAVQARAVAKDLMLMLLNAKSARNAYSAFRDDAPNGSDEKRFTNRQLNEVQRALEEIHPNIAKYFGADIGITLMNLDSAITEIILLHFLKQSVPVLSVHDSYIVPVGYEDELTKSMTVAFKKVMGVQLRKNEHIAMKEQSERVEILEDVLLLWTSGHTNDQLEEHETTLDERVNPDRSDRYINNAKLFHEWLANNT